MNSSDSYQDINREIQRIFKIRKIAESAMQTIGLIGNLFLIVIYSRKKLSKLSLSMYFRCQAISCVCNSILQITDYSLEEFQIKKQSDIACKLLGYFTRAFIPMAAWFEVIASLDRFLTIVFPIRFKFLQKQLVQRIVVACLVAFIMLSSSWLFFVYGVVPRSQFQSQQCFLADIKLVSLISLIIGSLVPFVLMSVLSIATLVGVLRGRKRLTIFTAINNRDWYLKRMRDLKFGVTLLVLNLLFLLFNFPQHLSIVLNINPFDPYEDPIKTYVFARILYALYQAYYSIVFFVQLAVNNIVRQELWEVLDFRRVCS